MGFNAIWRKFCRKDFAISIKEQYKNRCSGQHFPAVCCPGNRSTLKRESKNMEGIL
jgi:hypothetical protein